MSTTPQALIDTLLATNHSALLTNQAADLLGNPVLLCDTSYHILGASTIHQVEDHSWLAGIKRGHWTYEFVAKMHSMGIERLPGRGQGQAVLIEGVTSLRRRLTKLAVDGIDMGYYIVLESEVPFESIPEEHYRLVTGVLGKVMSMEQGCRGRAAGHSSEDVLLDLLHGRFPDRKLLSERIYGSELDRETTFRLFFIDMEGYRASESQEGNLKALLGRLLPFSWSVYDGSNIVVLTDFNHRFYQSDQGPLAEFQDFLSRSSLRAGISDGFSDLFLLPDYAAQGQAALHFATMVQDWHVLIHYEAYSHFQMIEDLATLRDISFYCSESVQELARHDKKNNTEHLPTLFYYLQTGRSVQAAARNMHLHRNTINYRLERIRQLFGIDFDDPGRNYRYYFSALALLRQGGYRFPTP